MAYVPPGFPARLPQWFTPEELWSAVHTGARHAGVRVKHRHPYGGETEERDIYRAVFADFEREGTLAMQWPAGWQAPLGPFSEQALVRSVLNWWPTTMRYATAFNAASIASNQFNEVMPESRTVARRSSEHGEPRKRRRRE